MSTPAYLVDTDTESDPEEAPSEVEESQPLGPKVPLRSKEFKASEPSGTRIVSSHSLVSSDSTTPLSLDHPLTHVLPTTTHTRVSFHYWTARMVVRTQPTLSPDISAHIVKATALSLSPFCKRYISSYETSSSSSLTLPVRKRYRGISELILDTDSEVDKLGEEDTEEDESSDANDKRERAARHRALESIEDITPSMYEVGQSSRSGPEQEGVERISAFRQPTLVTWVDLEDERVYTDILAYAPPTAPVQILPSPKWSLGSLPFSPSSFVVPSPIALLVATSTITISVDEDQSGAVRDEIFSQRYRFRSLEWEQERATITFRALWRPVLALEAWAGRVDTRLADMQRELQEIRGRVAALEQEMGRKEPYMFMDMVVVE
ncbi:hypothetical protein Tco_1037426 [Tanacetum coccineum]